MEISSGSSVEVLEGSNCTLQCTVDSNPLSNLTWIRGENSLIESVRSSKSLELIFPNVTSRDDGAYHCEAVNEHGQEKDLIKVIVEYPPRTPQIKVENVTTPGINENINVTTPDWSGKQENISIKKVLEGRSVNIHCSVDSSPLSNLTWIKGEKTILGKENIDKLTISISNVAFENEGQYWCVAKNKHGLANSSVFISVERKYVIFWKPV
ncbi:myelin-associated glycoprotein-like [Lissotriton helveticus]